MQPQQPAPQEDLAQWLKAFEQQKTAIEEQIEQFNGLQQELQELAARAASSPKALKQVEQVEALEQNSDYSELCDRAIHQIERLEQQFSQLVDWCGDDPPSSGSANRRQAKSAVATPPRHCGSAKKTARGFV